MLVVFDIGGSKIKAAIADQGHITPLGKVDTPTQDFATFAAALAPFLAQATAVSISIAGIVDPETGKLRVANIPCLNGRNLAQDLQTALGLPVLVLNDADCFALAEAARGAGQSARVVFGIILGTGVGGGIVINGALHQGAGGFAGEWGHGPILQDPALPCGCGQTGCLDTIGGARGIENLHFARTGERLPSKEIVETRPQTRDTWITALSGPLAMAINLIGPDVVPVGGGLGNDAQLIAMLDKAVRARVLHPRTNALLVPAICGADAGLIGAAVAGQTRFGDAP